MPHEDTLVLTLNVSGFSVCRILVDPVSLVVLLLMSAYKQMGYSLATLESLGHVPIEFNRATIVSLGDVVLPMEDGPITLIVKFLVMTTLSPYNVIIGQTWIHKMKAILSTYH